MVNNTSTNHLIVVKQLVHTVRSATWLMPSQREMILARVQDKDLLDRLSIFEEAYSEEQRQLFKDRPDLYQKLIKASDQVFNDKYKVVRIQA